MLFKSAQTCSSIFTVKPGGREKVVYDSGKNATFTCAVNGSDLFGMYTISDFCQQLTHSFSLSGGAIRFAFLYEIYLLVLSISTKTA